MLQNSGRSELHYAYVTAALCCAVVISLFVSAALGSYRISALDWPLVFDGQSEVSQIFLNIRLPRVLLACVVGASLAMAGAALQGLFRNPLADPSLIGLTGGAGLGAGVWIVLISHYPLTEWGLPLSAFAGSIAVTFSMWRLARARSTTTLLLAGIACNSMSLAGIGLLSFLANDQQLRSLTFWILGGLSTATWAKLTLATPFAVAGGALLLSHSRKLNAWSLGEAEAFHMGVKIRRSKALVIIGSTLLVGAAVSVAGGIGFLGLIAPHLFRLFAGADHRFVLPGSALLGALLLLTADTLSRTLFAPIELPVGILTAFIGGPFFIWILLRKHKEIPRA